MNRRCFLVIPLAAQAAALKFSEELWAAIAALYSKTLQHPFLRGLQDSTTLYLFLPHGTGASAEIKGLVNKILSVDVLGMRMPLEHRVVGKAALQGVSGWRVRRHQTRGHARRRMMRGGRCGSRGGARMWCAACVRGSWL